MGAPKLRTESQSEKKSDNPTDILDFYHTEELIIGLCGQLGTNLQAITKNLKDILGNEYGYDCEEIRLSDFIFKGENKPISSEEYERIVFGMDHGDEIRSKKGTNFLASSAIKDISIKRAQSTPEEKLNNREFHSWRKCFIINSIKHPDELKSFQKVYGTSFYLIGVFSPEHERANNLKAKINSSHYSKIPDLIKRDNDSRIDHGQKLRNVFVESDFFIREPKDDLKLKNKLNYFVNLIFDFGVNTPNADENAMFQAAAAAANSACLSRQVGACITDKNGNTLSLGWNDVPRFGGGVYLSTDVKDQRCFCEGWKLCTSSNRKKDMIDNIINDLNEKGIIKIPKNQKTTAIADQGSIVRDILKKNGINDLTEFGRSVHAEMHAIIVGSQRTGDKMLNGKLYTTTYPCHNCARHIIMAGIEYVYYIEPYSKSLCLELHKDAITEDEGDKAKEGKVKILMYEGVAPKSFIKFFQLITDDRKEKIKNQDKKNLKPKHQVHLESLPEKETHYLKSVEEKIGI
ncbi:MAG: anti-phage dCTP deaminase [Bacteroidales bacterium]|nr:anti-phage dCTP deaminase [Bacteroidales bacterium]